MKNYNVGIVGYGWVATAHIPAINATPLGQVTAVCSSRKLDTAALGAQHGGRISVYNDLDEGVTSHEAVFAADRSAELGRPVKMSELNRYAK